jgi:hypothetical protein
LHLASLCQLLWLCGTMKAGPAAGTATATARHCAANPISSILKWGESVSIYKNPTHFHIVIKAFPFPNGLKSCACRRAPKSWLRLTQSTKQMVACSSNALQAWHLVWIRAWICIYLFSVKCLNTCRVHMHRAQSCVTDCCSNKFPYCYCPSIFQIKYFIYRLLLQYLSNLFHNHLPSPLSLVFPLSYILLPYQFSLVSQFFDVSIPHILPPHLYVYAGNFLRAIISCLLPLYV